MSFFASFVPNGGRFGILDFSKTSKRLRKLAKLLKKVIIMNKEQFNDLNV